LPHPRGSAYPPGGFLNVTKCIKLHPNPLASPKGVGVPAGGILKKKIYLIFRCIISAYQKQREILPFLALSGINTGSEKPVLPKEKDARFRI
jgi:hypothetical protein